MPHIRRLALHDYAGHAFAYELAASPARRGIDIEYGWCATTSTPNGRLVDTEHLHVVPLGQGWRFEKYRPVGRAISELRLGLASARAIRAQRPTHVITCNMPVLSVLCMWLAATSVRARRILWFQDGQSEIAAQIRGHRDPVALVARLLESLAVRGAHHVVTISHDMRDTALRLGARGDRLEVLENWAPLQEMPQHPRDNAWAQRHGLAHTFTYLYSGTLARKHRPERLLDLAAELDRTGEGRLVVISTGEGADHLREQGGHLASLTVLPYQPFDELPLALASADVLVVLLEESANASSVPSKILSYLCAGRAVLGAMPLDNLASRILTERADAGVVVAPADADGFLEAARRLRDDRAMRDRMATNGRRYAEATFGDDRVTDEFLRATHIDQPGRVALVQTSIAGYRRAFIDELRLRFGDRLTLAYGANHIDPSLRTNIDAAPTDVHLANRFPVGRRFVFQPGYRRGLANADTWVLELNPRIVNTWLALLEGKLRRRRTVVWGHHTGRRIDETGPRFSRRVMVHLADAVLAYTEAEAVAFRASFPRTPVFVAPNAIDHSTKLPTPEPGPRTDFVYIGRLVADKHIDLLVDGFAHALDHGMLPPEARLVVVGDGPELDSLHARVERLRLSRANVLLEPGTYDRQEIDAYYATAVASACGGYVGLNLTQSLTRGVPMVHPARANHAPEVTMGADGETVFTFDPSTPAAVAASMAHAWKAQADGRIDHLAIQDAAMHHTIEAMADGFALAVSGG